MSTKSFDALAGNVYAYARVQRHMSVDHALKYAMGTAGDVRREKDTKAKINRRRTRRTTRIRH